MTTTDLAANACSASGETPAALSRKVGRAVHWCRNENTVRQKLECGSTHASLKSLYGSNEAESREANQELLRLSYSLLTSIADWNPSLISLFLAYISKGFVSRFSKFLSANGIDKNSYALRMASDVS